MSLGSYFDNFILWLISQGRFKNASEVAGAGLRLFEEDEKVILTFRGAVRVGEESGIASDFEPTSHLIKIKNQRKLNVGL